MDRLGPCLLTRRSIAPPLIPIEILPVLFPFLPPILRFLHEGFGFWRFVLAESLSVIPRFPPLLITGL